MIVPYKIKTVEPIFLPSREEREVALKKAGYNLFKLRAELVYIDFLTDSGTGAMSSAQWSRIMMGDESYAGSSSFYRLEAAVQEIMGLSYIVPTHQGRAAENILDQVLVQKGTIVPGNAHFDTTKAHIEFHGGRAIDCTIKEGGDPEAEHPFKGNVDLQWLEEVVKKYGREKIAYVLITITCNTNGGQPVSMENIEAVSNYCRKNNLKIFFDAARFAENAFFIKQREKGFENRSIHEIVKKMFSHVDGCTMSAKKDAIVPIGGFLAFRNEALAEKVKQYEVLFEGFPTYGGMSGMDMEALAQGLREATDAAYLSHRVGQVAYLGKRLDECGIPLVKPFGGHAIFVNGRKFYKKVPEGQFPAHLLSVELYKEGGIRGCEVGMALAGRDPETGENIKTALDLCRMAIPRRVYSQEHFDYVVETVKSIHERDRNRTKGMAFEHETKIMRHFTSTFKYL
ncbi:MAG: tyrosine phenol-lyase [Deltaproteobacteria bacterium RIFCSPLOWO2_02_FULL_47_10]|nr:MAG: tyrosine phenol-lyase [Deltaproteobacteria bacterium RIFCSPLOWO2_02_FULL_47_10]